MLTFARASSAAATVLAAALYFTGSANAQTTDATCVYASWSSNGDSQNPCQIWAALGSKCATFNVPALVVDATTGAVTGYPAPSSSGTVPANDCQCNLVAYSLMAACSWCQEGVYSDAWVNSETWAASCPSYNSNGVGGSVNTTGLSIPPYAVQALPGPWWDPTDAQKTQETLGSSGGPNGTTGSPRGGAVANSVGTMLPLFALAPLYLLL